MQIKKKRLSDLEPIIIRHAEPEYLTIHVFIFEVMELNTLQASAGFSYPCYILLSRTLRLDKRTRPSARAGKLAGRAPLPAGRTCIRLWSCSRGVGSVGSPSSDAY
jgi:hypothetical protein